MPQGNNRSQPWVVGPLHVWYVRPSLAKIPRFPSRYGMVGLKVSTLGPKTGDNLGFRRLNL